MPSLYRQPSGWLYHPYCSLRTGLMGSGLILYAWSFKGWQKNTAGDSAAERRSLTEIYYAYIIRHIV